MNQTVHPENCSCNGHQTQRAVRAYETAWNAATDDAGRTKARSEYEAWAHAFALAQYQKTMEAKVTA